VFTQGEQAAVSEPIVITLPYPPKELWPNGTGYFAVRKSKIKAQYRLIAKVAAMSAKPRGFVPLKEAEAQATYYCAQKRRRDADNALGALKGAIDGIVDAKVLEDDHGLRHAPVQFAIDKENPRVELKITAL
jgi:Holliday junction resolvase RusA-like endonuclease